MYNIITILYYINHVHFNIQLNLKTVLLPVCINGLNTHVL